MTLDCVLWDFDGTLAATDHDVWRSLVWAAGRAGGELDAGYMADDANLADPMGAIMRHVSPYPGDDYLETFDADVRVHYRTINAFPDTAFYPGVRELLEDLARGGVANVIVTNKPLGALERILDDKGWRDLFDAWITPDSAEGAELSKGRMIGRVVAGRGLEPTRCVYVGDSHGDVDASREHGIACIAVTYGDGDVDALLARGPAYVAHDAADIAAALDTLKTAAGPAADAPLVQEGA